MDETNLTKGDLWRKRIQDFYKSGLLRKQWCQEHQVPLSTLGYWIRKQTRKPFINEQKTAALADVRVRQHGFCEWISGLDNLETTQFIHPFAKPVLSHFHVCYCSHTGEKFYSISSNIA